MDFIYTNPEAKVARIAKEFIVLYLRLRWRLEGIPPKKGLFACNTLLSRAEEKALCNYIERLDTTNLTVRPEFV